jgi:hypothetical protein
MNLAIAHPRSLLHHGARLLFVLVGAATLCVAAHAAGTAGSRSEIEANYRAERAACMNGTSNQDRTTCLKEAGAARDEARRGQLTDDRAMERQNAVARCNGLPESDRVDCVRRVQGDGTVSGTAAGGGILRETVTIVPAAPDGSAP